MKYLLLILLVSCSPKITCLGDSIGKLTCPKGAINLAAGGQPTADISTENIETDIVYINTTTADKLSKNIYPRERNDTLINEYQNVIDRLEGKRIIVGLPLRAIGIDLTVLKGVEFIKFDMKGVYCSDGIHPDDPILLQEQLEDIL